ncbi:uncharacterized protein LOC142348672 [Convolutriloba macropyga]|uniref:uncharacterized protein LOC142348672 n=1 Tax=Convolutriloba macropyga TaxID=536237 RepID=UPI003F5279B8
MSQHVVICALVMIMSLDCIEADIGQADCPGNATYLPGVGESVCLEFLVQEGLVTRLEAFQKCQSLNPKARVVSVKTKPELEIILNWANGLGLNMNNQSGFWTDYYRFTKVEKTQDEDLSELQIAKRRDRNLYRMTFGSYSIMPHDLWRNESQPGNALDARDELCTAQSRPDRQPEFLGLDDYECEGEVLHFAICQVPMLTGGR